MFSAEWVLLRELIEKVRLRFPTALLVGGGEHFTALPEYVLGDCPPIDVIVKGEGEATFHALIGVWQDGDFSAVPGICLRGDSGYQDNGGLPRMREVDDVIDEIKHYIECYAATSFQLYDLTAFTRKRWTVEFCRRLKAENLNIRWSLPSGTRSEVLDEEVLELLRDTGCDYIA